MKYTSYNERWAFSNGIRWYRLGRRCRGFGIWVQRTDKAKPRCWPEGPDYPDGPPDGGVWYEGDPFPWDWPIRPFIPLWKSKTRRVALMLPRAFERTDRA